MTVDNKNKTKQNKMAETRASVGLLLAEVLIYEYQSYNTSRQTSHLPNLIPVAVLKSVQSRL